MNKILGDASVGLMTVLLFVITVLFLMYPGPAKSGSVKLVIQGLLGVVGVLIIGLIVSLATGTESEAH
ncbi:hypothetical protein J2752_002942 [Halarchaeum rubridurum]|uniref:Uncharacterized protein n=1 Tax=Halarchaeum rubridurum TaxID=489911 RepID=A0A830G373_9EURY|nr:hypothetical protein [Halarchaeum rubridurum]MBP1956011.1 hypothetical protein [Halarchaeum rubridurum]GGM73705.1 hypothetical protein GCM10009017_24550 [Halarchaeum rubridurum]